MTIKFSLSTLLQSSGFQCTLTGNLHFKSLVSYEKNTSLMEKENTGAFVLKVGKTGERGKRRGSRVIANKLKKNVYIKVTSRTFAVLSWV